MFGILQHGFPTRNMLNLADKMLIITPVFEDFPGPIQHNCSIRHQVHVALNVCVLTVCLYVTCILYVLVTHHIRYVSCPLRP